MKKLLIQLGFRVEGKTNKIFGYGLRGEPMASFENIDAILTEVKRAGENEGFTRGYKAKATEIRNCLDIYQEED